MDKLDKNHKINVAYDLIRTVAEDTDEEKWGYVWLTDAMTELRKWFEEPDEEI